VGRVKVLAVWLLAALVIGVAYGEGEDDDKKAKSRPAVTVPAAPPPPVSGEAATVRIATEPGVRPGLLQRRELSFKQRRDLGLDIKNLVAIAKELLADGEIDDSSSRSDKAAAILARLHDKNPQAFSLGDIDWDALLDFIERLIGLIEKIMGRVQ
jgi:hypothetical protein